MSLFKYLGCTFSVDGKLDSEFTARKKSGDAVASQLRSRVFNKNELSCDTKLFNFQTNNHVKAAKVGAIVANFCSRSKTIES